MIFLFTDFGHAGPYAGQVKSVLAEAAPGVSVIDLMHDAPPCDPRAAAYLLAALADRLPRGSVLLGVVDPGVGGSRPPVIVEAGGLYFVGPGNGLFEIAARRAGSPCTWTIAGKPDNLSATFHGRDLFAPAAARMALALKTAGDTRIDHNEIPGVPASMDDRPGGDWPDDLAEVIYIDGFGNAFTGVRTETVSRSATLVVDHGGKEPLRIGCARTFSDVPAGAALWYGNSNGLAEIAVNGERADERLGIGIGTTIGFDAGE